jgi:hypothetical protein
MDGWLASSKILSVLWYGSCESSDGLRGGCDVYGRRDHFDHVGHASKKLHRCIQRELCRIYFGREPLHFGVIVGA